MTEKYLIERWDAALDKWSVWQIFTSSMEHANEQLNRVARNFPMRTFRLSEKTSELPGVKWKVLRETNEGTGMTLTELESKLKTMHSMGATGEEKIILEGTIATGIDGVRLSMLTPAQNASLCSPQSLALGKIVRIWGSRNVEVD